MVRLTHLRRLQAFILLVLYVLGTFLPSGFASAQSFFSRPGAGVSRLPLHVWAFEAPGFGDVSDAINLANGNVFVSMDGYSRNNLFGTSSGTANVVPEDSAIPASNGQWNYTSRLWLNGFDTRIGSSASYPVPNSFTLGNGDGSGQTFNKVTITDFSAAAKLPSWITRYKSTSNIAFYKNVYYPGMDYQEEWLVMLLQRQYKPAGQPTETIAHYYDHNGTRYTFYGDGQYVDYIQTPYQQYRPAKIDNQSEGIYNLLKTSICYNLDSTNRSLNGCYGSASAAGASNQGRIRKVIDEYNRTTSYEWNSNGTLAAINYLLRDINIENS